jgi:hypothetical protein
LDQLYLEGSVAIRWDRLYMWFNARRLGKNAYREIIRTWEELCTTTYGHAAAPEIGVLVPNAVVLNLKRKAFPEETVVPLADWT